MFCRPLLRFGFIVSVGTGLVGCTLLYPRFDNLLNPDIAFPNIGEVVDSVKCAVTNYYIERASRIRGEALARMHTELGTKNGKGIDTKFCPEKEYWDGPTKWRIALYRQKPRKPNDISFEEPTCEPFKLLHGDPTDQDIAEAVRCFPGIFYEPYKYVRLEDKACRPNGGCIAGTRSQSGKCVLDDKSRFALDPTGKAKIELTLQAVNSGSMSYQKIDASRWGVSFIVPGDQAKGFPFPTLKATDKKTNKVELTLTMPQADSVKEDDDKDAEFVKQERKLIARVRAAYAARTKKPALELFRKLDDPTEKLKQDLIEGQRKVLELTAGVGDYKSCGFLKVNFLALSTYINNIVSEQESQVYKGGKGGIEVALDSLVLTSQFQISFDATAGTQYLLRIVPVLQPPVLGLSPDHTHSLKITFAGKKGRAFASSSRSLQARCIERLQGLKLGLDKTNADAIDKEIKTTCERPATILMETLIEAVEGIKSAGAN